MLNSHLIVIFFNLPWEWSTDYTNQIAQILAKSNLVICCLGYDMRSLKEYLQSCPLPKLWERKTDRVYCYKFVHFIPFYRFSTVKRLNYLINVLIVKLFSLILKFRIRFQRKILWVFDPQFYDIYKIFGKSFFLIYDIVDYFKGSYTDLAQIINITQKDNQLLKNANLVTVNSHTLKNLYQKIRPDIKLVPQGFRMETFHSPQPTRIKLPNYKPIIGYIGGFNNRLDYNLLINLVKQNFQLYFVLVGQIQERHQLLETLFKCKNVFFHPEVDKSKIPNVIKQFTVGIIPYKISSEFNRYCYPMKMMEYFYMGKPVIATPIEELKRFPKYVKIGKTAAEWEILINKLLSKPWPEEYKKAQRKLAIENSWTNKIEAISKVVVDR